jgi:hypothetical protein
MEVDGNHPTVPVTYDKHVFGTFTTTRIECHEKDRPSSWRKDLWEERGLQQTVPDRGRIKGGKNELREWGVWEGKGHHPAKVVVAESEVPRVGHRDAPQLIELDGRERAIYDGHLPHKHAPGIQHDEC